jgi:hypothetical protein
MLTQRGFSVLRTADLIDVSRKALDNGLAGRLRMHPVMMVRVCAFLGVSPEKAFTRQMLDAPARNQALTTMRLVKSNYHPELDEFWAEFLESMGWDSRALEVLKVE